MGWGGRAASEEHPICREERKETAGEQRSAGLWRGGGGKLGGGWLQPLGGCLRSGEGREPKGAKDSG